MRILLSIISFLFFIAPVKSEASAKKYDHTTNSVATHKPGAHLQVDHLYIVPTAHILHTGVQINSDIPYRPFFVGKYLSTDLSIERYLLLPWNNGFIEPYSYCKSIGLKLIFPKHYFW